MGWKFCNLARDKVSMELDRILNQQVDKALAND